MGGILISYLVGEIPGPFPLVTACNWSARVKKKPPFYRSVSGGLGYKTIIVKVFQNFLELYHLSLTAGNGNRFSCAVE